MAAHMLEELATDENFEEKAYLAANPDVANAVKSGIMESGRQHFVVFGSSEKRKLRRSLADISETKRRKLQSIAPLLRDDMPYVATPGCYDFLTEDLKARFNIVDTDAVSSNHYDGYALDIIHKNESGLVLDCGAGKRPVYFDNVVNFEIVDYESTDVRGVGEVLPFKDATFDAVISIAVLEHVKDPFACAKEIARVLKPGGQLMCCVPFLQPLHGYPHHYYNMTHMGLQNLFSDTLEIDQNIVYDSILPIWSLTWILRSWAEGLEGEVKEDFTRLTVADLMQNGGAYLDEPWVRALSSEKNMELASATVLFAHKAQV